MNDYQLFWIMLSVSLVCFIASYLAIFTNKLKFIRYILRFYAFFSAIGVFATSIENKTFREVTYTSLFFLLCYILVIGYLKRRNLKNNLFTILEVIGGVFKVVLIIGSLCFGGYLLSLIPNSNDDSTVHKQENIYFENCTDAFYRGYSNITVNEPGYESRLDRDNDGVACER